LRSTRARAAADKDVATLLSNMAKELFGGRYWLLAQQPLIYCTHLGTFIGIELRRPDMPTVLIVEDEPQIRALVQSFIEQQGHKTLSAATADEALTILTGPEAVDALFDMQAGIEFAKRAVELKPDLKVLYSAGLPVTDGMKGLVLPGSIILEKPYTEDQLLTSLSVHFGAGPQPHVLD
jgi:CheY-like chemotaxis protein